MTNDDFVFSTLIAEHPDPATASRALQLAEAAVLRRAADAIEALPQDYECDPGRGDAVERLRRTAAGIEEKCSPAGATATPREAARERRLEQLLDTMRTHGGKWTTSTVQTVRRTAGDPAQRGTARRDLAELHRRGHLHQYGAGDGRYYTLKRRTDGA